MTDRLLDRPARPSLRLLPRIDRLPPAPFPDPVRQIASTAQPWDRQPVLLAPSVTAALWTVLGAAAAVGAWLVAVLTGAASCSGPVCALATLGDHPVLLTVLATVAVLGLIGTAFATRGLTEAGGPALAVIVVSAAAGVVSVLGVLAVIVLAVLVLAIAVSLLAGFVDLR